MATPQTFRFMNEEASVANAPSAGATQVVGNPNEYATVRRYTPPTPPTPPQTVAPTPAPAATIAPTATGLATTNKPTLATIDENAVREDTRKRMQSTIDAINANFANLVQQEQVAGQDRSGQTRGINARSGLMGSDFGEANRVKTDQFNQQQVKYLEDEKTARINAVLLNIEDRASAEIQRRKQEALGQYQMEMGEFEKMQEQARADFETLARSGTDLGKFSPEQKSALFKQAGYDENWGDLIYNAMKPKPQQIDYKFEKLADGRGMFYGVDPQTGQLITKNVEVDLPPEWNMTIAPDGSVIGFDKNTGQARLLSGQGEFAKPEDPLDQALKQAQIDKIYSDIANGGDVDGVLSLDDAEALGVPYGTTKSQAIGIVPGSAEKIAQAETGVVTMQKALELINELKNHPGMDGATGTFGARVNIWGDSRDFVAKFDQLKALLSLESISKLKGTGAISDAEQQLLANSATALRRDGDKGKLITELDTLAKELLDKQTKMQNIVNAGSAGLMNEFEQQYENRPPGFVGPLSPSGTGGSEGTNPK